MTLSSAEKILCDGYITNRPARLCKPEPEGVCEECGRDIYPGQARIKQEERTFIKTAGSCAEVVKHEYLLCFACYDSFDKDAFAAWAGCLIVAGLAVSGAITRKTTDGEGRN